MPIDTITEARNEILGHINTAWNTITPPIPKLFFPDKKEDLPDNAPYGRVTLVHTDPLQVTSGGDTATGGGSDRVEFRNARIGEVEEVGGFNQVNVEAEFNYDRVK